MKISKNIAFTLTDWLVVPTETHAGETGFSVSRTCLHDTVRTRLIEFSANYLADHWCEKGHFIYCISGRMTIKLKDGSSFEVIAGMSCQMGDGTDAHKLHSKEGCKVYVVD